MYRIYKIIEILKKLVEKTLAVLKAGFILINRLATVLNTLKYILFRILNRGKGKRRDYIKEISFGEF